MRQRFFRRLHRVAPSLRSARMPPAALGPQADHGHTGQLYRMASPILPDGPMITTHFGAVKCFAAPLLGGKLREGHRAARFQISVKREQWGWAIVALDRDIGRMHLSSAVLRG